MGHGALSIILFSGLLGQIAQDSPLVGGCSLDVTGWMRQLP